MVICVPRRGFLPAGTLVDLAGDLRLGGSKIIDESTATSRLVYGF